MAGIQNTLDSIEGLKKLGVDVVKLVKAGVNLGNLGLIFQVVSDLKSLTESVPDSLPELAELDAQEVGQLSSAAYAAVKEILGVLK